MSNEILCVEITEDFKGNSNEREYYIKGERYMVFNIQNSFYQLIDNNDFLPTSISETICTWLKSN